MNYTESYKKYRGKCKEATDALVNGFSDCEECGKPIPEAEIIMQGRYPVCSTRCTMRLVGL